MSTYIQKQYIPDDEERVVQPDFLRPHEVARKLGISRTHVLQLLRDKRLPGFKIGKKAWLIRASELDKCLKMRETLFANQE